MQQQNYNVYKNIMSINPVIEKDYLSAILRLTESEKIEHIAISEVIESNTALVIKSQVNIVNNHGMHVRKLFIKTTKSNNVNNPYRDKNMRECYFYKFLLNYPNANLPVPTCYDVFISEETSEFVIVLEDLSECYKAPDNSDLRDKNTWFLCAESLAKFHATFWNNEQIGNGELVAASEQQIEKDIYKNQEYLKTFLKEFNDRFDTKTIKTFENAMAINNALIRQKNQASAKRNNITICNGDSHIYNFLLPNDNSNEPVMVDFQFWGDGFGTGDLAHLTRVKFSYEYKKEIQIPLVRHYYETLLKCGVEDYSWEDCINNYRKEIATMVLIPMWQYCCFGLKYDEWIGDIKGLIDNYEYLNCDGPCPAK